MEEIFNSDWPQAELISSHVLYDSDSEFEAWFGPAEQPSEPEVEIVMEVFPPSRPVNSNSNASSGASSYRDYAVEKIVKHKVTKKKVFKLTVKWDSHDLITEENIQFGLDHAVELPRICSLQKNGNPRSFHSRRIQYHHQGCQYKELSRESIRAV